DRRRERDPRRRHRRRRAAPAPARRRDRRAARRAALVQDRVGALQLLRRQGALMLALLLPLALAHAALDAAAARPDAIVDLASPEGARLVGAEWRVHDASITAERTVSPRAEVAGFDDSAWTRLAPGELDRRIGPGNVSFAWYRARVTLPARIGAVEVAGATVVFENVVDDYAEGWGDGKVPIGAGPCG